MAKSVSTLIMSLNVKLNFLDHVGYVNETRRLYGVLEGHLKKGDKQFILGDKFTLADIKTFPWSVPAFLSVMTSIFTSHFPG